MALRSSVRSSPLSQFVAVCRSRSRSRPASSSISCIALCCNCFFRRPSFLPSPLACIAPRRRSARSKLLSSDLNPVELPPTSTAQATDTISRIGHIHSLLELLRGSRRSSSLRKNKRKPLTSALQANMSALAPVARAASIPIPRIAGGVVLKPIFVHPSHFEGSAPTSPYLDPSASSPFNSSYSMATSSSSETPDAETLARVENISLDFSPPSPSLSLTSLDSLDSCNPSTDFFAAAFGRSTSNSDAESYFTLDTSPSSSNSSTPTCESPTASFKPASEASEVSSSLPIVFPASFPFATFAAPVSRPASPPVSAVLRRASTAGGSMMARSVSSPVETQRELDQRRRRQADASELMHESATKMARTRSMAAFGSSSMMSRAPSGFGLRPARPVTPVTQPSCPSPLVTPFEEGWGAALPPREKAEPAVLPPFPFNHVGVNYSPGRLNRSHSATYVPQYRAPRSPEISSHLSDAAQTASLSASSFSSQLPDAPLMVTIPNSPSMTRPRRSTLGLAALTPIIPTQGFEVSIDALPPMAPGRLTRGASFS